MPREKKDEVWGKFVIKETHKNKSATCKKCNKHYENANITRLTSHLEKCKTYTASATNSSFETEDEDEIFHSSRDTDSAAPIEDAILAPPDPKKRKASNGTLTKMGVDTMKAKKHADKLLAEAIYSSGCPLSLLEDPSWQEFLTYLRPAYKHPSRYMLSSPLLDNAFHDSKVYSLRMIEEATVLALMSDGWTNTVGEGIINFIVTTPTPVFYDSKARGTQRETSEYIATELISVLDKIGPEKFLLLITDCAANMKAAWAIVTDKFPHITACGCGAHGLQNFTKDICSIKKFEKIYSQAKNLVKHLKVSHVRSAVFKEKQFEKYGSKSQSLKLPVKTRFGYIVKTLSSLEINKAAIQATVIETNISIDKKYRSRALDDDYFWPTVSFAIKILQPITDAITKLEGGSATLSEMVNEAKSIEEKLKSVLEDSDDALPATQSIFVMNALKSRMALCLKPIHYACYLLDPRFRGEKLNNDETVQAYSYIDQLAAHLEIQNSNGELLGDIGHFRGKTGFYSHEVIWKAAVSHSPAVWWKSLCGNQPLSAIASKLLSLPPTACACERNWADQGIIHSSKRNRLKSGRVRKIVAVRYYLRLKNRIKLKPKRTPKKTASQNETEAQVLSVSDPPSTDEDEDEETWSSECETD